jgi:uncharacterized integral membrane protein
VGRIVTSFLFLVILFLVLGIAVLNPSPRVDLNLFFGTYYEVPLVLALFVAFLVGSLLTFLYLLVHTVKLQLRVRDLKIRIRQYEKELIALRNIPVVGEGEGETLPDRT